MTGTFVKVTRKDYLIVSNELKDTPRVYSQSNEEYIYAITINLSGKKEPALVAYTDNGEYFIDKDIADTLDVGM